jgi:hypothetical protein
MIKPGETNYLIKWHSLHSRFKSQLLYIYYNYFSLLTKIYLHLNYIYLHYKLFLSQLLI